MNVWNKVFLGVIFAAAVVIVLLASVDYSVRNAGQKRIADLENRITDAVEKIDRIRAGADPLKLSLDKTLAGLSLAELRGVVRERYVERGRAWFSCTVDRMDEETLPPGLQQVVALVTLTSPLLPSAPGAPISVAPPDTLRGTVYVFEEGGVEEEGEPYAGLFIGRFIVEDTPVSTKFNDIDGNEYNGWRVKLVSRDPLSEEEIEQIFDATTPQSRWAIYLSPPIDRVAGIFSRLTEEEKQMIPEELLEKFAPRPRPELTEELEELIERLETLSNDPNTDHDASVLAREEAETWRRVLDAWEQNLPEMEVWKQYHQSMDDPESEFANDFAEVLDWLYLQISNTRRDIEVVQINIATFEATDERAQAENDKLENVDIPLEEKRVDAMVTQREAVKALSEQYDTETVRIALQIEKLQTLIKEYVVGITEAQLRAAEKIETQIRHAAQTQEEVR